MKKIKAYCVFCEKFLEMKHPMPTKIGIGKKMGFVGRCPDCDSEIFTLDKKEYIQRIWGK